MGLAKSPGTPELTIKLSYDNALSRLLLSYFTPLESPVACPVRDRRSYGVCSGDEARPASRSEDGDKIPFRANTGFKAPCEPSRWKVEHLLTGFTISLQG